MTQVNRLPCGLVDRNATLTFNFDGREMRGHPGDTLASALLANGVRLMGRSFKYHRPRGVFTAGSDEPNALVALRGGGRQEPNTRATTAELYQGLWARSQNRVGSLSFDLMAVNDLLADFLTAGFYYKTFMWPAAFWEKLYEPVIRRAAGLGALSGRADPDVYDKGFLHCDLLVIGAGPSGLMAALTAGRAGADVILTDEDFRLGGRLNAETLSIDDAPGADWAAAAVSELSELPNVRLMPRTTIVGAFDHGIFGALERVSDHVHTPDEGKPRQVLWRIYSQHSVLCAGATERHIAFENNDRPGIMQGSAMRTFVNRFGAAPARRVAVFTNSDEGHQTAADLHVQGIQVVAVVDVREDAPRNFDYEVLRGAKITNTQGRLGLSFVEVQLANGEKRLLDCGALAVSGGWNPNVHLTCHQRGRPKWREDIAAFVPGRTLPVGMTVAGAATGEMSTAAALRTGYEAARDSLDLKGRRPALPKAEDAAISITPFWYVEGCKRGWLDFQNDVTVKDVQLSHQEGFRSVEHLKRYTTLGMATDQGKTSNVSGLAIMAEVAGKAIPEVGTTIYRPPYTPTAIGAFAGRAIGPDFHPTRLTPSHKWAEEQGAVFVEVGNWLRAQWFPRPGETHWRESVDREALAVRETVGICDVTTLGKVDVQGMDAAAFLNFVYSNGIAKLAVGRVRYGLMLREDGFAMDDGTAARLAEDHFVVTTTTANAVGVYRHMEFVRQCLRPDMDVQLISTTEAWAQFAVAGPRSRELLRRIVDDTFDLSNEAFPFMACAEITICGGLRARLFRISFSGELAYEIAVPTRYGDALVRRMISEGEDLGVTPYGVEALGVLRIEKGHCTGNELNGQTSALQLGLGRMVSDKKDSIGAVLSRREVLADPNGPRLVGLQPAGDDADLPAGAHLMPAEGPTDAAHSLGHVTSTCFSPNLGCHIALALVDDGGERMGETLRLVSPLTSYETRVKVVSVHFVDPDGDRLRV
ncbi:MAG: sarcosine oxidase subunit alpha family protein [Pseudomonadota bacterium]